MPFCIQCGRELRGDEGFCPDCGHAVVAPVSEPDTFCYACGEIVPRSTAVCPRCGARIGTTSTALGQNPRFQNTAPSNTKEPILGVILSFLITGLGTIYAGYLLRGLLLLGVGVAFGSLTLMTGNVLFSVCGLAVGVYSMYDAYHMCNVRNRGK